MSTSVEGIVLKSFNYGEHHKILKVITHHHGIIGVFVQNANRTNNKKSALVQPVTCAHFNLKQSNSTSGGLYYLYNGEVINHYLNVKLDYEAMIYIYLVIEIVLKGLKSEEDVSYYHVYEMLKTVLDLAEQGVSSQLLAIVFQFKMLTILGIEPQLDCCANCHKTQQIVMLSITGGGLMCERCVNVQEPILIDASLIPLVRALARVNLAALAEVEVEQEFLTTISTFLTYYYEQYAGFHLSTKKFINSL